MAAVAVFQKRQVSISGTVGEYINQIWYADEWRHRKPYWMHITTSGEI